MDNTEKKLTWADLKEFADGLNEQQLQSPLIWWGDERGGKIHSISKLSEDFINDSEYYSPKSSFDEETLKELEEDEFMYGYMPMGTPILYVD